MMSGERKKKMIKIVLMSMACIGWLMFMVGHDYAQNKKKKSAKRKMS